MADKTEKQYRQAAETLRRGDPETAEREFEEILRAKPKYAEARILLGVTHVLLGQKAEQKGDRIRAAGPGEGLLLARLPKNLTQKVKFQT
jgi:Tfp pilus assembly protein PilF